MSTQNYIRLTRLTVFPASLSTEMAVAWSTFSSEIPFTLNTLSFTLKCVWQNEKTRMMLDFSIGIKDHVSICQTKAYSKKFTFQNFAQKAESNTYCNLPSAGPAVRTSEMAIDGSPLEKWGLSLPPLTAIPNPNPVTCNAIWILFRFEDSLFVQMI